MSNVKKKKSVQKTIILISTAVALILILASVFIIKALLSDDGDKKKRAVQMVSLVKPPPPPEIEEKPPEPEIEKEEILEPEPEEMHEEMADDSGSDQEAGSDLGIDAEGVAGSDGFGLTAKPGGKALIGSDTGNESLLKKFAWYTAIVQGQIQEELRRELEKKGGIPEGDHEAVVRVVLDEYGDIVKCQIVDSSGNERMDEAIRLSVTNIRADEPPPYEMPRAIKIKVSSKG